MIDSLLQDIQSPDPQVRGEAIIRLANLRDPGLLPTLAQIHRTDPDPRLRELALKAGRYIQLSAPTGTASALAESAAGAQPAVSPEVRQRARGLLDAAAGYHVEGQHGRAIESLGRALDTDPALATDTFASNLAIAVSGLPRDEAIAAVRDRSHRAALIAQAGGKKKLRVAAPDDADTASATWGNVTIDVLLYALISALSTAAIFVLTLSTIVDLFESLPPSATTGSLTTAELDMLTNTSLGILIPFALISGLYAAVGVLIQGAAIHFAAITFFGGAASLVYFYRRFIPFQTVVTLAYAAIFIVAGLLGSGMEFWLIIGATGFIGSIVVLFMLSSLLGKVYSFGSGAGCGAILLGGLVLAAVSFFGSMILSALLSALINALA